MRSEIDAPRRRPFVRLLRRMLWLSLVIALLAGLSLVAEKPIYALRLALRPSPTALPVPVSGVAAGALRDTWGAARNEGRTHQGIDIFAPRGRPVLASTEGLVWRIGENRLGGTVVWVMGPGRQLHYYAHLERIGPVSAGMRVVAGDLLGYVGNSGNARGTPPHLHYGVYTPIGAINPYPLLKASPPLNTPQS